MSSLDRKCFSQSVNNHRKYHHYARMIHYAKNTSSDFLFLTKSSIIIMSSTKETNNQIHYTSFNSITSEDDNLDYLDDDDDDNSNDRSNESTNTSTTRKKTLGRVKIKMSYIDNKVRRYTTFSKRKTGIMKKAYELATLTGTEVMLLVASETGKKIKSIKFKNLFDNLGHVYTYATPKLQPMITSEKGKALIQTCLAKDEPPIIESTLNTTTLNNNDVIFIDENQRNKRTNSSIEDTSTEHHPTKHIKLNSSETIKPMNTTTIYPSPSPTTITFPLSCLINSDSPQQSISESNSFNIDLNSLKNHGMDIVLTPLSNTSQPSPPSNIPLVLTLGNFPYQSS